MSRQRTIIGDTVLAALDEFGAQWPSKTIARHLADTHPALFASVEHARNAVRQYRGVRGTHARETMQSRKHYRPPGHQSDGCIPLPSPLREGAPWNVFEVAFKRALLISDVHIPFHDLKALTLALDTGKKRAVDAVIINGDLMDFYRISKFDQNPESRTLDAEIQQGRLFLEHLRDRFPKALIILKEGNHEERLWRYAWTRCPELFGVKTGDGKRMLSLASMLDADEYGVTVVADKRPVRCGPHLHLLHGHEFRSPFQNPVGPARGLYLRAKCNAVCGDLHQSSNHTETGLTHTVSCWSAGCLCDLHPGYMPLNKWNLGFGVIELSGAEWSYQNLKIINGSVVAA